MSHKYRKVTGMVL